MTNLIRTAAVCALLGFAAPLLNAQNRTPKTHRLEATPSTVAYGYYWAEAKPALRIAFRNNGPPLAPDERARVFEAFFTTKTHGTGLGMTIAKRIVESHGGRIEVGAGPAAEFVITLPRGGS